MEPKFKVGDEVYIVHYVHWGMEKRYGVKHTLVPAKIEFVEERVVDIWGTMDTVYFTEDPYKEIAKSYRDFDLIPIDEADEFMDYWGRDKCVMEEN